MKSTVLIILKNLIILPFWILMFDGTPNSKVHGANMGPIWGRQDPGGPHVGLMNFAFTFSLITLHTKHAAKYMCVYSCYVLISDSPKGYLADHITWPSCFHFVPYKHVKCCHKKSGVFKFQNTWFHNKNHPVYLIVPTIIAPNLTYGLMTHKYDRNEIIRIIRRLTVVMALFRCVVALLGIFLRSARIPWNHNLITWNVI